MTQPPHGQPLPDSPEESGPDELARSINEFTWLLRQCWADAANLLALEGRIAVRSLLFLVALIFCLAGLLAGAWLVLVLFLVYGAASINTPTWAIVLGVILLHILAFAGLARQMLSLARLLSFPRSRQAAADLMARPSPEPE